MCMMRSPQTVHTNKVGVLQNLYGKWQSGVRAISMKKYSGHFVKSIGIYPVGTLVRMESGRLGVVVEQQVGKSLLSPKVRVFFCQIYGLYRS
jgi:hypothetical protein